MIRHFFAAVLSLGILSACQSAQPNSPENKGALRISVQFPKAAFSTQLIQPETRVIYVAVYSDNQTTAPQIFGPITPRNPQVRLSQLTAGNQTIVAAAYDEQKQILTAGRSLALVKANSLSQASLELEADYSQKLAAGQLKLLQDLQIQLPALDTQLATDLQPSQNLNPNLPVNVTVTVPVTEGLEVNTGARSETTPDGGQTIQTAATPTPVIASSSAPISYQSESANSANSEPTPSESSQADSAQHQPTQPANAQATAAPVTPASSQAPPAPTASPAGESAAEKAKKEKEAKEAKEKREKAEKDKKDKQDKDNSGHGKGHDDDDDDHRRGRGHDHDDDHDDDD